METGISWLNEAFIISSAVVMAVGWAKIRQGKKAVHRRLMITASILAALFFLSYVLKTIIVGDTSFGGPHALQPAYQLFLQIHSILATVAAIMGIITLTFALRSSFTKHRRLAPWTAVTWFVTAATGLTVFLLLYVIYTPGPTTNLFQAWLG